jgi:hypothetical protein
LGILFDDIFGGFPKCEGGRTATDDLWGRELYKRLNISDNRFVEREDVLKLPIVLEAVIR